MNKGMTNHPFPSTYLLGRDAGKCLVHFQLSPILKILTFGFTFQPARLGPGLFLHNFCNAWLFHLFWETLCAQALTPKDSPFFHSRT